MGLWRQLVQSGILSDAEFWATRQSLLSRSAAPPKQRQAFASQMIASVVPSEDGKGKQARLAACAHRLELCRLSSVRRLIWRSLSAMLCSCEGWSMAGCAFEGRL